MDVLRVIFDRKIERLFQGVAFYAVDMAIKTLVFSIPLNYMMYAHWQAMKSEGEADKKQQEAVPATER